MSNVVAVPPSAFYFSVSLGGGSATADASFREVSGIRHEMDTAAVAEGGENRVVQQLPKGVKHSPLVLKRGVAPMSSALVAWCRDVLEGGLERPVVPKLLLVSLLNENGQTLRSWSFADAYPVKWEIEPFNSTRNEVAIEMIALSYQRTKREL